jgi:hypothetical protein
MACGYCFPDLTVEQLADIVCLLIGVDPQQVGPAQMLECLTTAAALKAVPVHDPRTKRIFQLIDRGANDEDQRAEIHGEFRKLIESVGEKGG